MSLFALKDADVCALASRSVQCDSNRVPDAVHLLVRIHVDDEAQFRCQHTKKNFSSRRQNCGVTSLAANVDHGSDL